MIENFRQYADIIRILDEADPFGQPHRGAPLTYSRDGPVEVMYAPFDHVSVDARLAIVGITPGRAPAIRALRAAHLALRSGASETEALRSAKLNGSFSSPGTRRNLVQMMDEIGLNRLFDISSTRDLFTPEEEHVHFTSALRYPVFVNGHNYNGTPHMLKVPILRDLIETCLAQEARMLARAVWLPLGPKPTIALSHLVNGGILRPEQVLEGMPHPSGANSERVAAFLGSKKDGQLSRVTNARRIIEAKAALLDKIAVLQETSKNSPLVAPQNTQQPFPGDAPPTIVARR